MMSLFTFRLLIVLLFVAAIFLEGWGLATSQPGETWSGLVRAIRFDPVGRVLLIVFWTWFSGHIFFTPEWKGTGNGWRDLVYLGVGAVLALCDSARWFR